MNDDDHRPTMIGTRTPEPNVLDPYRIRKRANGFRVTQPRKKKTRVRGEAHQQESKLSPPDIRHVKRQRRRRIRIVTGEWLRPFYD